MHPMEGTPVDCGWFCLGGVASLLVAIIALRVKSKSSALLANEKEREWASSIKTTEDHTSSEIKAGEPPGDTRLPDNRDGAPSKTMARPFGWCGALSVAAPFLGAFTLKQFFSIYLREHIEQGHLFGGIGPTSHVAAAQTIMGCAGLMGFVFGCISLARRERYRGFALLGLLVNGPFMFLLFPGLTYLGEVLELMRDKKLLAAPQPQLRIVQDRGINLRRDARLAGDPGRPDNNAHANVYGPSVRNQHKKPAQEFAQTRCKIPLRRPWPGSVLRPR
jgi:hypothetical protein